MYSDWLALVSVLHRFMHINVHEKEDSLFFLSNAAWVLKAFKFATICNVSSDWPLFIGLPLSEKPACLDPCFYVYPFCLYVYFSFGLDIRTLPLWFPFPPGFTSWPLLLFSCIVCPLLCIPWCCCICGNPVAMVTPMSRGSFRGTGT